jgi:integrase/recombinase XerD
MLGVYRRHESGCKLKDRVTDGKSCPKRKDSSSLNCPVWIRGTLRDGTPVARQSLNIRTWPLPEEIAAWELGHPIGQPVNPLGVPGSPQPKASLKTPITEAARLYILSKGRKSPDRQRKLKLMAGRLIEFASRKGKASIQDLDLPLLTEYVATWRGKPGTQKRDQENLRGFFAFCVKAKWISNNPAADLETIRDTRPQTDVFTYAELKAVIDTLPQFPDEYGRCGGQIALQMRAFVLVMRYTGLSIGDVAGLPKAHVHGTKVMTNRDKTEKEVYVRVPQFVIDALEEAPHDSEAYFFWSGSGKIHTRASKWGERVQRLFVLAGVRLMEAEWTKKSTRSKKARERALSGKRIISEADPRWFRHTLARDLLENEICTMTELAEILGNSEEICRLHYSKWDNRRQTRIDEKLGKFWSVDPMFDKLSRAE